MPFFKAEIERTVRIPEAQLMKEGVLNYRPKETEKVASAYRAVRDEIIAGSIGIPVQKLHVSAHFVEEILEMTDETEEEVDA